MMDAIDKFMKRVDDVLARYEEKLDSAPQGEATTSTPGLTVTVREGSIHIRGKYDELRINGCGGSDVRFYERDEVLDSLIKLSTSRPPIRSGMLRTELRRR